MIIKYPDGATPIDAEEIADLIPIHLLTQDQLNAWEEDNIIRAQRWALTQKYVISVSFIQELHRRMFDKTWKWAGKYRTSEKNLGITWYQIPERVKKLCDNILFQLNHQIFPMDENAIRFHHQLVWIHPFANGNGRHARLMADLLIIKQGGSRFTWGYNQDLQKSTPLRKSYIRALKLADQGDYSELIAFARLT